MVKFMNSFFNSFTNLDYILMIVIVVLAVLDTIMLMVHLKPSECDKTALVDSPSESVPSQVSNVETKLETISTEKDESLIQDEEVLSEDAKH